MKHLLIALVCLFTLAVSAPSQAVADDDALEVKINARMPSVTVPTADGPVKIMRNQDTNNTIDPAYAKTSRKCPPFCVQPMQVAPGVTTVGEVELLEFAKTGGKLIDGRTVEWHVKGTIPGALNMPYTQMAERLDEIGCTRGADKKWDCAKAEKVLLFCNGPWCGQSPMAIKAMLREGYPADKILYYRGGMQAWHVLGLTVVEGNF
ncbi:MAG TPA: rhodanese-like domain-containing protein [Rhodospirillaceae bacterium]|nr:sulfurtransferase [Magnetovibrio sp.]HCS70146.1 rhodanese-like domain-containing protein [Rhodospirillaceae bacterium]|tara:strand:+ start:232 stop:849 length:618 start_codon:yes stop_codon:yes gene_type:complete